LPATAKIKFLKQPTSEDWIHQAINNLDTILLDHSHCERKAAGVAINLMFRYPSLSRLVRQLTIVAQEELEHFELVNQWLERKQIPLGPLSAPPYGAKLKALVRKDEPQRMLDWLLIAGLIEARSHERLGLIAEHCPDQKLSAFYRGLMASEAKHYGMYWMLSTTYFEQPIVIERLEELARVESEVLSSLYPAPRIHS